MENATTIILPVGDFTSGLARKVADTIHDAATRGGAIVISLQWTARWSWDALCELAADLRDRFAHAGVRFTRVPPTGRALLREVGIDAHWIVESPTLGTASRVLVRA